MGGGRMEDGGMQWMASPRTFGSADLPDALPRGPSARLGLELALCAGAEVILPQAPSPEYSIDEYETIADQLKTLYTTYLLADSPEHIFFRRRTSVIQHYQWLGVALNTAKASRTIIAVKASSKAFAILLQ